MCIQFFLLSFSLDPLLLAVVPAHRVDLEVDVALDTLSPERHGADIRQRLGIRAVVLVVRTSVDRLSSRVIPEVRESVGYR